MVPTSLSRRTEGQKEGEAKTKSLWGGGGGVQ